MKLVFAGTPEFARVALEQIHQAGHQVLRVLTQPDRPAGRGLKLQPSPVKQWAMQAGVPVSQPRSLRLDGRYPQDAAAVQAELRADAPEVMVVAAYGLLLPPWVLALPRAGCLNIHASLLPRWRGAAPIQRAIEAGDAETGITLMQMDAGLDTGAMLLREPLPIGPRTRTGELHDRLAELGGRLIVQALAQLAQGPLPGQPQPAQGVSYARKIDKAEAGIDWSAPAAQIERRVRAFDPAPGASTTLRGEPLKVWQAEWRSGDHPNAPPGTVLALGPQGLAVACGQGQLWLSELQRAGGKRLPVAAFLRGCPVQVGEILGGGPEQGSGDSSVERSGAPPGGAGA